MLNLYRTLRFHLKCALSHVARFINLRTLKPVVTGARAERGQGHPCYSEGRGVHSREKVYEKYG